MFRLLHFRLNLLFLPSCFRQSGPNFESCNNPWSCSVVTFWFDIFSFFAKFYRNIKIVLCFVLFCVCVFIPRWRQVVGAALLQLRAHGGFSLFGVLHAGPSHPSLRVYCCPLAVKFSEKYNYSTPVQVPLITRDKLVYVTWTIYNFQSKLIQMCTL